jgi:hypothetical protein
MTIMSRNLKQDVTHWPVTGSDGYGGFAFGTPVKLTGRWEERAELFIDENNEEVRSNAICYLSVDVDPGDYLAEGDLTATPDPATLTAAYRVRNKHKTTDLRALVALRKVFL